MKVLKTDKQGAEKLAGFYNGAELSFEVDADGNYVVNLRVLIDKNFAQIKEDLEGLDKIDYNPKKYNL